MTFKVIPKFHCVILAMINLSHLYNSISSLPFIMETMIWIIWHSKMSKLLCCHYSYDGFHAKWIHIKTTFSWLPLITNWWRWNDKTLMRWFAWQKRYFLFVSCFQFILTIIQLLINSCMFFFDQLSFFRSKIAYLKFVTRMATYFILQQAFNFTMSQSFYDNDCAFLFFQIWVPL